MRLSAFPPSLVPPELLSGLLNLGLKTDTDLLLLDVRDIMKCLPPGCISFQELRQIHETIAARASAHGLSALDIRSNCLSNHHKYGLSSGINELDALMNGFGGGRVLEVSGEKGTGKSVSIKFVIRLHN